MWQIDVFALKFELSFARYLVEVEILFLIDDASSDVTLGVLVNKRI